jgi:hypothetical protein
MKTDITPTRRCECVSETKKSVKPGCSAISVGFPCMWENVTPVITPSKHTRMQTKDILKISGFYVPQLKRNVP